MADNITQDLKASALSYHRNPRPGKIEIQPTKPLGTQRDLALAYTPGVAVACEAIAENPAEAATLTARQNLVGVVTNGTAVLGLGAIGPLASKPVMEGKAVLFKKFAGIDVFDIELDETDVERLVDVVAAMEPTFGGINLEDIKAPECFEVEAQPQGPHGASRSSTTTSTAPRSSWRPPSSTRSRLGRQALRGRQDRDVGRRARRRLRPSTCWSRSASGARTSGSPTSRVSSTRAATSSWTSGRRSTRRQRTCARSRRRSRAPTSSSGCRPAGSSSPRC